MAAKRMQCADVCTTLAMTHAQIMQTCGKTDAMCGRMYHSCNDACAICADMAAHDKLGLRSEWVCREKSKGSTCKTLVQLVDERDLDLLVIGNFGRKGEKL
eukprot:1143858-Pelagomonas_calceolata.AAC.7